MPRWLRSVLACYRALLWLFPAEFRMAYGREMADVFEQQLAWEFASRGPRGVVSPVWYAMREVFTMALPGRLVSEGMLAASLSLLITPAVLIFLVAMLQDRALAQWVSHKFLFGGQCHPLGH